MFCKYIVELNFSDATTRRLKKKSFALLVSHLLQRRLNFVYLPYTSYYTTPPCRVIYSWLGGTVPLWKREGVEVGG
jgi:hypothetical protein